MAWAVFPARGLTPPLLLSAIILSFVLASLSPALCWELPREPRRAHRARSPVPALGLGSASLGVCRQDTLGQAGGFGRAGAEAAWLGLQVAGKKGRCGLLTIYYSQRPGNGAGTSPRLWPLLCRVQSPGAEEKWEEKGFWGDMCSLCAHPHTDPLREAAAKARAWLLSPPSSSCLVQGQLQEPAADPTSEGNVCPWDKGHLNGSSGATQVQHGFKAAGFEFGSHDDFGGGQRKFSPLVAAVELLARRGVSAFRLGPAWSSFGNANRTWGAKPWLKAVPGTQPVLSQDKGHLIPEQNRMGLEGRNCLRRCRC